MSVPEYVFLHRIQEFYDELRSGRNLWKIDETLGFVDEKGRAMIKKWIQDPRFPWTFGRGYTILQQRSPIISLVVDSASDRSYMLGNYATDGTIIDPLSEKPQAYWQENARFKTGSFLIVMTAPNSDMLTAIYCLIERALYEGESSNIGEENIIQFSDYNISELRYSGTDIRPDQSYIPTNTWARSLRINCTYLHTWSGRHYSDTGYAFSINLGNVSNTDGDIIQTNPEFVDGVPVLPTGSSLAYIPIPGTTLNGSTSNNSTSFLTSDGLAPSVDNILIVPPNTSLIFDARIGASVNGQSSALWTFSGVVRRENLPSSTVLVGLTSSNVVADTLFANTYIDIETDPTIGALNISATGADSYNITWTANIQFKEIS